VDLSSTTHTEYPRREMRLLTTVQARTCACTEASDACNMQSYEHKHASHVDSFQETAARLWHEEQKKGNVSGTGAQSGSFLFSSVLPKLLLIFTCSAYGYRGCSPCAEAPPAPTQVKQDTAKCCMLSRHRRTPFRATTTTHEFNTIRSITRWS